MPRKVSQQGQALVIIVMVMVLSLATGLAVATRSTSSVHQTTNIANSEQALATAESAAEELLKMNFTSCISPALADCNALVVGNADSNYKNKANPTIACNTFGGNSLNTTCVKSFTGGGTAEVLVKTMPEVTASVNPFKFYLEKDDTQQVWLQDPATSLPYIGDLDLSWGKIGEYTVGNEPALEVSVISKPAADYVMTKYAYDLTSAIRGNGFDNGSVATPCTDYTYCLKSTARLNLSQAYALRIRSFYSGTSVSLSPVSGSIPYQGYVITVTGQVGDTKRSIEVMKTKPQLPAVFDYGVYSGGTIQ